MFEGVCPVHCGMLAAHLTSSHRIASPFPIVLGTISSPPPSPPSPAKNCYVRCQGSYDRIGLIMPAPEAHLSVGFRTSLKPIDLISSINQ